MSSTDSSNSHQEVEDRVAAITKAGPDAPSDNHDTPETVQAEQEQAWQQAALRKPWYRRRLFRVLFVLGGLVALAAVIPHQLHVTSECVIRANGRAYARSPASGTLAELPIREGSRVKAGDVIARLDDRDLTTRHRTLVAEVSKLEAELKDLQQSSGSADSRSGAVVYDLKVTEVEAELTRAKAERELVEQQLEQAVIRAPIDGVVTTPDLADRLHATIEAGGVVCEIVDTRTVMAEILVPERDIDAIALGMPVEVKVESYPFRSFAGSVDFIAPKVEKRNEANVVRVVAHVENPDGILRDQMTGYGQIECGRRSLLELATRRIVRWIHVRFLL